MDFARKVWKLIVAVKDGLVLVFMLIFFFTLFAILTARPDEGGVRDGALVLALDGVVVEERSVVDPFDALLSGAAPTGEYPVRDIVHALDTAAKDERIEAVVLDLSTFLGGGQVHLSEIGAALERVKGAGKPVLSYAMAYGDDGMLLAAHATEAWVDPLGGALVAGPGGERLYYAGLIDRLNINAKVYRVGTYKSAVEPYLLSEMSPEARENANALYGALWEEWQANVKKARPDADLDRITSDPAAWVESARGDLSRAAVDAGLIDAIGSKTKFGERVAELVGEDLWSDAPGAYPSTDLDIWLDANPVEEAGNAVGVITIAGEIVDGEAGPGTAGGTRIADLLDEALASGDLKALVVRVDSPGGSVTASEEIRQAIVRYRAAGIPVAVSMANVAASGGYWVSTPAERIFAEPETITGSIGIFGVIPTFEDTLADIGVTTDGVKTTPLSGQPDPLSGFTPEVDTILQAVIENNYARFLTIVARSRSMDAARVDSIAQGRVWDGGSARQLGLVDQFGGLDAALQWAASEAGLEDGDWHARYLASEPDGFDAFLAGMFGGDAKASHPPRDVFAMIAARHHARLGQVESDVERLVSVRGAQAMCLECPVTPTARSTKGPSAGWLARIAAGVLGS
ncbi:signal peptide peptidase SppA [Alteriqipengyuania sp. WL0013]|uniref:signal peptide peptidase SppA n=1 Tax=Alteriqipengyuania sp. WL0013 TaxID=3110773 RepID=UPI002BCAA6CE|nr:signal peptide peptidase SppA [Alteriqipengyuania sp. WL0013]MEB3416756.1 signal peptide peptidase SppA [Alteriqipengyuania sp. WL0013]